jgi:hypothetical protein
VEAFSKQLTRFRTTSRAPPVDKVGQVTEEFIKSAQGELKQQKKELEENR